ncbi:unnamed protein product [Spirodela intermedia]|uniref:proline--tRNA ligase n=1 Tax=Spirodela intermedia TaxID=51605 RepID=A0A7I8IKR0_SPIIN|nr:unnamed protein product [Spirodela intermedia]CAA6658474.1 unnamed protein product [Spirodela intermedia]
MFTQWIHSYRDLPLMINQWANVTRWKFLWQEGHTAHGTPEEAEKELPYLLSLAEKSTIETFAGASRTYTIEAMMGDQKALQAGTSHNLGQNFSHENGQRQHVWQTSWAISTRFIGGIIMTHGDDAGLMLPPKIAPVQVVIVPIWKTADEKVGVLESVSSIEKALKTAGIKVKVDDSEQRTPGWKYNFWEMKGRPRKAGKEFGISMEPSVLVSHVNQRLDDIQASLLQRATTFRDSNIVDVTSYEELKAAIAEGKWARGPWSARGAEVKEETGATIRCFPFDQPEGEKTCLMSGQPAPRLPYLPDPTRRVRA